MPSRIFLMIVLVLAFAQSCKEIKDDSTVYDNLRPDDGKDKTTLPDPCAGDRLGDCDPLTGQGCADSDSDSENDIACQYGYFDGESGFFCYSRSTEPQWAACDRLNGPWCAAGLVCAGKRCMPQCCSNDDCTGSICSPLPYLDDVLGGGYGYCRLPDPCAGEILWECNPLTNEGCPSEGKGVGQDTDPLEPKVCDFRPSISQDGFACYSKEESTGAEFDRCGGEAGPWCAQGLTCLNGLCTRYCCSDEDCPSLRCEPISQLDMIAGGDFGACAL